MFERFTDDARAVVMLASEHARRLGHRYVGGEHLLLAAVTAGQPASTVMCARGVTPELVEEEIVRRVGLGAGPACSAAWTRTRWPRSGSTWTRCEPGSRRPSGRRRSPAPPRPRTVTCAGARGRGRHGGCASGAAGAGTGGPCSPRTR